MCVDLLLFWGSSCQCPKEPNDVLLGVLILIIVCCCCHFERINHFTPTLFSDCGKNESTKAFSAILV